MLTSRYGGWLCLDFANIADARNAPQIEEHLHTYQELVWWAADTGAVDGERAARLYARAAADPEAAQRRLAAALELREAVFRTFRAAGQGAPPPSTDVAAIQTWYAEAMRRARLDWTGEPPRWAWDADDLDQPAWAVAISAVELATHGPLHRVKVCAADEGCAGLFVDTTKNNSRRWCEMAGCGNEAKFRRQTARRRTARSRTNAE